ncbi:MAG: glucose-6-phosphate dehydrogenase, partial [Chitinophagaceae bacterium]
MTIPTIKREPTVIFIFGGSGDLAHRKLLPALYNLYLDKYLPDNFFIVGIGRTEYSETAYLNFIKKGIQEFSRRKDGIDEHWK